MTRVFVDRLGPAAALSLALRGLARSGEVLWLDATPGGLRLHAALRALALVRAEARDSGFHLAELRDVRGACRFPDVWVEVRELVSRVDAECFAGHPFLRALEPLVPEDRIRFQMRKALAEDLAPSIAFADAATREGVSTLLVERSEWSRHIVELAQAAGVRCVEHGSLAKRWRARYTAALRSRLGRSSEPGPPPVARPRREALDTASEMPHAQSPVIASWYTARTVAFDRARRSDLFWALDAPVPRENLLVYFDRPSLPVTAAHADTLAAEGIEPLAIVPAASAARGVHVHAPGPGLAVAKRAAAGSIVRAWLGAALRGRPPGVFLLANAWYFATQLAWWSDFFEQHGVKVSVSPYDFTRPYAAKNLALERLGGVSVSYQWSNIDVGTVEMSGVSDAMLVFGPRYERVLREAGSLAGRLVHCGYPTDHAFEAVRPAASELRAGLEAAGARFVVALFDENSSDARMAAISNERARELYRGFLEPVLADPSLGLVIKPGYPLTLRGRLGEEVAALLDEALETGRVVLVDQGTWVTERYPAEAAQAADACAGLLMSGTAALEAWLAGARTVFVDLERLYDREVYEWGRGAAVFDSCEAFFEGLRAYRGNPAGNAAFGDLSRWAEGRVAFADGRAATRIGGYVARLHAALAAGRTRDEALAAADDAHVAEWGDGSVVPWR